MSKKNIKPLTANLSMNVEVTEVKSEPREITTTLTATIDSNVSIPTVTAVMNPGTTLESNVGITLNSDPKLFVADYIPLERVMSAVEGGFVPRDGFQVNDIVRVTKEYYGDVVIDSPHATTARWDNDLLVVGRSEDGNPILQTKWQTFIDTIPAQHLVYIRKL